jgi:hypothetical protein
VPKKSTQGKVEERAYQDKGTPKKKGAAKDLLK